MRYLNLLSYNPHPPSVAGRHSSYENIKMFIGDDDISIAEQFHDGCPVD